MIVTEDTYCQAISNIRSFTTYHPPLYEFVDATEFRSIPDDKRTAWYIDDKAGTIIHALAGPHFRAMWELYKINGIIKCRPM